MWKKVKNHWLNLSFFDSLSRELVGNSSSLPCIYDLQWDRIWKVVSTKQSRLFSWWAVYSQIKASLSAMFPLRSAMRWCWQEASLSKVSSTSRACLDSGIPLPTIRLRPSACSVERGTPTSAPWNVSVSNIFDDSINITAGHSWFSSWRVCTNHNRLNLLALMDMKLVFEKRLLAMKAWFEPAFFRWNVSVFCPVIVLKLDETVFINLPCWTLWPNWLFRLFKKYSVYDQTIQVRTVIKFHWHQWALEGVVSVACTEQNYDSKCLKHLRFLSTAAASVEIVFLPKLSQLRERGESSKNIGIRCSQIVQTTRLSANVILLIATLLSTRSWASRPTLRAENRFHLRSRSDLVRRSDAASQLTIRGLLVRLRRSCSLQMQWPSSTGRTRTRPGENAPAADRVRMVWIAFCCIYNFIHSPLKKNF